MSQKTHEDLALEELTNAQAHMPTFGYFQLALVSAIVYALLSIRWAIRERLVIHD